MTRSSPTCARARVVRGAHHRERREHGRKNGAGSTGTGPKTQAGSTTFTAPRGKRTTRAIGASPSRAAALLAGALLLALGAAPGPAQAQTRATIWSATLTVDRYDVSGDSYAGCANASSDPPAACTARLSDDDFAFPSGTDYDVTELYYSKSGSSAPTLLVAFGKALADNEALRTKGTLVFGSGASAKRFALSSGYRIPRSTTHLMRYQNTTLSWTNNEQVAVSITVAVPAPTGVRAAVTDTGVTLSWNAVTGATYEYQSKVKATGACGTTGYGTWQNAGSGTSKALTLTSSARQCFRVRAKIGGTAGPASSDALVLAAPSNLIGARDGNTVTLSWDSSGGLRSWEWRSKTKPAGACGTTGYGAWQLAVRGFATSFSTTTLGAGSAHCVQVREAIPRTTVKGLMSTTIPLAAPTITHTTVSDDGNNDAHLHWSAVDYAESYTYGYELRQRLTRKACSSLDLSSYTAPLRLRSGPPSKVTDTLEPSRYCIWVQASTSYGPGPKSTAAALIGPPTNVKVSGDNDRVTLTWTKVFESAVSYEYQSKKKATGPCGVQGYGPWHAAGTGTRHVVTTLTSKERHCLRVRATKGKSTGFPSAPVALLAAPTGLAGEGRNNSAILTWNAVTGAAAYEYQLKAHASGPCATNDFTGEIKPLAPDNSVLFKWRAAGSTTRFVSRRVANKIRYCARVRAKTSAGVGHASTAIEVTPRAKGLKIEPKRLDLIEGGRGSYTVVLDTKPTATVNVRAQFYSFRYPRGCTDRELFIPYRVGSPTTEEHNLWFTTENWNVPQRVRVWVLEDGPVHRACQAEGGERDSWGKIGHFRGSTDPDYHGGQINDVQDDVFVAEFDNDLPGRMQGFHASPNPVREGGEVTLSLFRAPGQAALSVGAYFGTGEWDGTAEMGDWGGACGGFRFEQDQRTATCTVTAAHDADADDEWFSVSLGPSGQDLGDPLRITILDDDGADETTVSLEASAEPVREGEWTEVAVRLSRALASGATIPLVVTPRSAEDTDWEWHEGATARILPGERSDSVWLRGVHDEDADDETLEVSLGTLPEGLRAGAAAAMRLTIDDDEESVGAVAAGNAGRNMLAYWDRDGNHGLTCPQARRLGLRLPAKYYVDADACMADWAAGRYGTAACALDRTAAIHTWLGEHPTNAEMSVRMTLCADQPNPGGYVPCASVYDPDPSRQDAFDRCIQASLDEADDAPAVPPAPRAVLNVANATAAEPGAGGAASLGFVVTLAPAAAETVSVDYATRGGTARAGADYAATSGTLHFSPCQEGEAGDPDECRRQTIEVGVLPDAHDEGRETMTLVLSNAHGARLGRAEATGTITNTGAIPRAWTARFGRSVAAQVLDAVEARMGAAPAPGVEARLAGTPLGWGAGGEGAVGAAEAWREAEARRDAARLGRWLAGGTGGEAAGLESRTVTPRALLSGSSFALTAQRRGGDRVSFWGRGAVTRFDGREGALTLDGEVATGMLGADWTWGRSALPGGEMPGAGRLRAGLVFSHSEGEGGYAGTPGAGGGGAGSMSGEVEASLTGLFPWARHRLTGRVEAWGVAGFGQGVLEVTPKRPGAGEPPEGSGAGGAALRADLDLWLAAAGLRGTLLDGGEDGFTLAAKTDTMAVHTASGRGRGADGGTLAPARATVTRLRLGVEARRPMALGGGASLTPSFEAALRHDGGEAETGFGLDLGGGVALSAPARGFEAALRGRGLLTHEAGGLRERGLSGSLAWRQRPDSDRGATLSLTQTVGGAASGGAEALFSRTTLDGLAANDANGAGDDLAPRRLEAKLGYGLPAFGDRFTLTPEAGAGLADTGRDYRLGLRLAPAGGDAGAFELILEATRREAAGDPGGAGAGAVPEHAVAVRLNARF